MISVKERSDFIIAVAGDPNLSKLAYRVAVMLTKYLNRKKGYAWPSVRRLADDLHADRRNVQHALGELVEAGWWVTEGSVGRKHTNHYKLGSGLTAKVKTNVGGGKKRRNSDALSTRPQKAVTGTRNGVPVTLETAYRLPPEPCNEPLKNAASAAAPKRDRRGVTGKRSKASQSNGRYRSRFMFGPVEAKIALDIAGWDGVRARQEFGTNKRNFRQWNHDRGTVTWAAWCEQGLEIDKKNAARQSVGGKRHRSLEILEAAKEAYNELNRRGAQNV